MTSSRAVLNRLARYGADELRTWAIAWCVGAVVVLVLFPPVALLLHWSMRSSGPYQDALREVRKHPAAAAALGEPVRDGWMRKGSILVKGSSREAKLAIPVSGPKGSGMLYVQAREQPAGGWRMQVLELAPSAGPRIDLRNPGVIAGEVLRVVREITIDQADTVFNFIEVAVDADVVTLSGTVRHASRGKQIAREVAKISGVREVRNELHSPRDGAGDERVRRELVRGIYGSLSLSRYARHAEPPIRILVERGKVVLAGRVSSRVERELLTQIAERSAAFEVENDVAIDAELANVPAGGAGVVFR